MKQAQSNAGEGKPLTAVTVMRVDTDEIMVCPFFGKCDGLLVMSTDGKRTFVSNDRRNPEALCDLILCSGATRLICGFVPDAERRRLRAAGIDVRLGSCSCPIGELVSAFEGLTEA